MKIGYQEVIDERLKNVETSRNVNQKLELLENNHMDYINPVCSNCNSKKINNRNIEKNS